MSDLVSKFTEMKFTELTNPNVKENPNDIGNAIAEIGVLVDLQKYSNKKEIIDITYKCTHILQQLIKLSSNAIFNDEIKKLIGFTGKKLVIQAKIFVVESTPDLYQNISADNFASEVIAKLDPHNLFNRKQLSSDSITSYYKPVNPKDFTANIKQTRDAVTSKSLYSIYYNAIVDDEHVIFKERIPRDSTTFVLNDVNLDLRAASTHARTANNILTSQCMAELFALRNICKTSEIKKVNKKFEDIANIIKTESESATNDAIILDAERTIDYTIRNNISALSFLIQNSTDNNNALSSAARAQIKDLNVDFQKKHPFLSGKYFNLKDGLRLDVLKADLIKASHNETEALANAWIAMFPDANATFAEVIRDHAQKSAKELEIKQKDQASFKYIKAPHFAELYKDFFNTELKL